MVTKRRPDSSIDRDAFWRNLDLNQPDSFSGLTLSAVELGDTYSYSGDLNEHRTDLAIHEADPKLGNWLVEVASKLSALTGESVFATLDEDGLDFWIPLSASSPGLVRSILSQFSDLRKEFTGSDDYEIDCHVLRGGKAHVPTGATELHAA